MQRACVRMRGVLNRLIEGNANSIFCTLRTVLSVCVQVRICTCTVQNKLMASVIKLFLPRGLTHFERLYNCKQAQTLNFLKYYSEASWILCFVQVGTPTIPVKKIRDKLLDPKLTHQNCTCG